MESNNLIQHRPYQERDAADLAALLADLGYPAEKEAVKTRMAGLTADHHTIVAESDGRIAGFIGLLKVQAYETPVPLGYILALSIATDQQRRGIGKALVAAAEEYFRAQGVTDIRVSSGLHREEAHRFYEALGYRKTGYRFRKSTA